jgi:hypothetical protein
MALEWSSNSLYMTVGGQRRYVGTVVPSSFNQTWTVVVRGEPKDERIATEADARTRLEAYAKGAA